MQVSPENSPQNPNPKGKSNEEEVKWMISVVIGQGRILSKFELEMVSYDPRTSRAFFKPVKTRSTRVYASNSKRHRPQIISITLLEYKQGQITAEEQISLHPLSFSVNEQGIFRLFRDKLFWHLYVRISMEDHSHEFNRKKDPQRWVEPLGFEVEVVMDDCLPDDKIPSVVIEEFIETDRDLNAEGESKKETIVNNHTFTEWRAYNPQNERKPQKWRRKLKKLGCNIRNAFK